MSRSVAGFAILLHVCAITGQQYPNLRLKGTPNDPSIAIGVVSGGNYPAGSFSIGYGDNNENDDGGPGADSGWNIGNIPSNGGNVPINPNYNGGYGQSDPNTGYNRQGQNGGGYVNGQNDIGSYGGQNNANNQYGGPVQNPGQKPPNPYDDNYNKQNTNKVPVRNAAPRNGLFSGFLRYILSFF